jgi:putative methionine-R-sulfoxide reductase with GAF domain
LSLSAQPYAGALEAVDRILNRETEADEVLRQTIAVVHDRVDRYSWAGLFFVEEGELVLGPAKGEQVEGARELEVPVSFEGQQIGSLRVFFDDRADPGDDDRAFLERVALLISAHCLVGWDTGGVPWSDLG